ncbi:hypothetical protein [Hydrogenophaga sp.]|uniref:hypothetical protein n=1 Tax=Hydrogenophaga sp. TaxID=1904254 RepID=UPI002AC8A1FA|nr:hypothetical protein [Hydrogenophaga sp.]
MEVLARKNQNSSSSVLINRRNLTRTQVLKKSVFALVFGMALLGVAAGMVVVNRRSTRSAKLGACVALRQPQPFSRGLLLTKGRLASDVPHGIHGYRRALCIKANTSTSSSITRTTAM